MNLSDTDYDTHLYLDAIWRRRYILLICIIIMPILAMMSSYILPQKYIASTSVAVNINALPAMKDISTPFDISDRFQGLKAFILSPAVLQKVAVKSGLVKANASATKIKEAADGLTKALKLNLPEKSNAIEIELTLYDPTHMVDILNSISNLLMQQLNTQEATTAQESMKVLSDALKTQKQKLDESIDALSKFESKHADLLPEYNELYQNQMRQINNNLGTQKAQYSFIKAEEQELEQALLKINPIVTEIDRSILKNEIKISKLRLIYTDNYPDIKELIQLNQSLKSEREKVQEQYKTLDENKIQQLWNMTISEPSATNEKGNFQLLSTQLEKLINMKLKLKGLTQEIVSLTEQQELLNNKLKQMTSSKQKVMELNQTIKYNQTAYEELLTRNNLAKMSVGLSKNENSNIVKVVAYPENPIQSQARPLSFLFFVGLIAGLLLGFSIPIVLELIDNKARTKRALEAATGLEVICRIERLRLE